MSSTRFPVRHRAILSWVFAGLVLAVAFYVVKHAEPRGSRKSIDATILDDLNGEVLIRNDRSRANYVEVPRAIPESTRAVRFENTDVDWNALPPSIVAVRLVGKRFDDADLRKLVDHSQIEELCLWDCSPTPAGVAMLEALPNLKVLWLAGPRFDASYVESIKKLKTLVLLKLAGTTISERQLNGIRVTYYSY